MGGRAFELTAERLTKAKMKDLEFIAKTLLEEFFPEIVAHRLFTDKATHGDLDLLCATDKSFAGGINNERGKLLADGSHGLKASEMAYSGRHWCASVCQALKGFEYFRHGTEPPVLSIAIKCEVVTRLCELSSRPSGLSEANIPASKWAINSRNAPFYQVNLNLVKREIIPYCLFVGSYNYGMIIVLSHLIKLISSGSKVHGTAMLVSSDLARRFQGDLQTETTAPAAICKALGLKYPAWLQRSFANDLALWEWFGEVEPESELGKLYKSIASGYIDVVDLRNSNKWKKNSIWPGFLHWLETSYMTNW